MNTKAIGELSEAFVLAHFLKLGWIVLQPFGDNQRYDLVIDRGNGFETVQVKTAKLHGSILYFKTCSSYAHRGNGKKGYKGQVDLFATYSPELNKVYLMPVDIIGSSSCSLRIEPSKNHQQKKTHLASEFEI